MRNLSEFRLKIITILLDDKGHTNGEISRSLGEPEGKSPSLTNKKSLRGYDKGDLSKTLNSMIQSSIIFRDENDYYITQDAETFSFIINQIRRANNKETQRQFLESNYVNNLIRTIGFMSVLGTLHERMKDNEFRETASYALLKHSGTIEEYKNLTRRVKERFNSMENIKLMAKTRKESQQEQERGINSSHSYDFLKRRAFQTLQKHDGAIYDNKVGKIDELEALRELGTEAVRFYRKTLLQDFINLFASRMANAEKGPIIKYVWLDNYLSPFTAYPINSPIELIFSRSFERLYADVYLIDSKDREFLLDRANLIFENFHILSNIFIRSRFNTEAAIRELILNWNVACARFETIYHFIGLTGYKPGKSCFHLLSDGAGFQIIDLKTNERLLGETDMKELEAANLNTGFFEFDQTQFMRPVLLEHLGQGWERELVPIESVISRIKV